MIKESHINYREQARSRGAALEVITRTVHECTRCEQKIPVGTKVYAQTLPTNNGEHETRYKHIGECPKPDQFNLFEK